LKKFFKKIGEFNNRLEDQLGLFLYFFLMVLFTFICIKFHALLGAAFILYICGAAYGKILLLDEDSE